MIAEKKFFDNDFAEVTIENKIINLTYKDGARVTLQGAKAVTENLKKMLNNEPHVMIADIRNLKFVEKEAKKFLSTNEATDHLKALAIFSDSVVNTALGNFYLSINKPKIPSKLFNSMDQAIKWVEKFE